MKTINKISFARLSNAYHVSFLFAIKADIDKYKFFENGAPAIGIPKNLYEAYVDQLEKEQDIVNRTRSSEYTPVLAQLEQVNDEYERIYVLRSSDKAHNADTSECRLASEKLYINVMLSIQTIANAIFDSEDIDSASKAAVCNACIDDINQLIKEFKQKAYPNGTAEDDEEEDNEDVNVNENSSENAVNAEKENVSVNAD